MIFWMFGQTSWSTTRRHRASIAAACLTALALAGCERSGTQPATRSSSPASPAPAVSRVAPSSSGRDLSADEDMGGHTLARHIGKTDDELRERLRREPNISSASTYTDRPTAEAVVAAALSSAQRSFEAWRNRTGRRSNFVLHYWARRVIGRSVARGQLESTPCEDALVVLRWDDRRQQFFVLTSYPEERRR